MKPNDYAVTGSPAGPIWSTQIDPSQYTVGYPHHQGIPSPQSYPATVMGASQLAEQMEKGLTLSDELVNSDPAHIHSMNDNAYMTDKSRMSPIVQRMPGPPGNGRGLPGPVYGYSMQPGMDQVIVSPTTGAPPPGSFFPGNMSSEVEQHMGYPPQLRERQDNHQTLSHLQHSHPGLLQAAQGHPQGMYPHSGNITPQPAQILGHSLSTTIFSPPPSAGPGPPTVFYSPTTGKPSITHGGSPAHAPVGSGIKFKKYTSPVQLSRPDMPPLAPQSPVATHQNSVMLEQQHPHGVGGGSPVLSSNDQNIATDMLGSPHQLPPRLNQRGGGSGTRYQNQRHPSNRNAIKGEIYTTGGVQGPAYPTQIRREPLLPTPNEMIKLDTGITGT